MHSVLKHSRIAGPVGEGLGRFSGYNPYIGLPFSPLLTCRSINAKIVKAHTRIHTSPDIRSGFSRNIGATASGIEQLADYAGLENKEVTGTPMVTVNDSQGNKFFVGVNFQIKF